MTCKEEKVVQRVVQAEGTACAKLLNEKECESLAARAGDSVLAIRVGSMCPSQAVSWPVALSE